LQTRSRLVGAAVALAILGTGCSSEPPMAAADYFAALQDELARLDQATRDLTDRFAFELEEEMGRVVATLDPSIADSSARALEQGVFLGRAKMGAIISAQGEQVTVFVDRVDVLTPPETVAGAHAELLTAFSAWAAAGDDTIAALDAATDLNDLAMALSSSPFADAQLRVNQACRSLVDNAAAVGVELSCPGTEVDVLEVAP